MKRRRSVITSRSAVRDPYPTPRRRPALIGPAAGRHTAPPPEATAPSPEVAGRPGAGIARRADGHAATAPVDLTVDLGRGLRLANPVLVASGTFGYGIEYGDVVDIQRLGAICCKGTTLAPRQGNVPPRVTETPAGMLNSIGLQNPGVDGVIERYAPRWARWKVPVIVNVAGESIEDYVAVVRRLEGVPGVAGIELNISCPNVGRGGLQFALDPEGAEAVTAAVRRATDLPLMVKLSPNVSDVRVIARAVEAGGADAISAINTLSGLTIDRARRRPLLGNTYGGLSGPAVKPVALRIVFEVAQTVRLPIVAIGGVTELADVLDFLMAGACAVQVGTAIFADPGLPVRLVDELDAWCRAEGLASHRDLVGAAQPGRSDPRASTHGSARSAASRGRGAASRASARGVEYRP
ncbi:MAG TPA: dihydroorotate dehydrogenase [Candidatus Limnocylindrales bacterium]|nr:dihydroorotate dehydrogenase [Candidatus Limnocylindrales bacterium]